MQVFFVYSPTENQADRDIAFLRGLDCVIFDKTETKEDGWKISFFDFNNKSQRYNHLKPKYLCTIEVEKVNFMVSGVTL